MSATSGPGEPFALLTSIGDLAEARMAAAVLESEGLEARLHGEALGPYRFSVGDMARVEIWVRADLREEAAAILEAAGIAALAPPEPLAPDTPWPPLLKAALWLVGAMLVVGLFRWAF